MNTTRYRIELADSEEGMRALQPAWDDLYARTAPRNPFLSFDWTDTCREHLCRQARPFVLAAWDGERLAALAPLCLERRFGARVLRFMGDGRSDYLGILGSNEEAAAREALLCALWELRPRWDLAVLRQLCEFHGGVRPQAAPQELTAREADATLAPYLPLTEGWKSLVETGPGLIKRTQRHARKFAREGGTAERYTHDAADRLGEIVAIEAQSWKQRQGMARFQGREGRGLLREALGRLGPREAMEVWIARQEGRPLAFLINFVTPERVMYYQGAYDAAHRKSCAGGVLLLSAIERACRQNLCEFDFMSGDESYKDGWTTAARPIRYLALYPPSIRGRLAFAALVAPRWRMKESPRAHAALRFWKQLRSNPAGLLAGTPTE